MFNAFRFFVTVCVWPAGLAVTAVAQTAQYSVTRLGNRGGTTSIQVAALNDLAQVVGHANKTGQDLHAFSYNGAFADLGTLGGAQSWGQAVNNAGTVVGYSNYDGTMNYRAFKYSGGVMTDLGTLGGGLSQANGINESGVIVGTAGTGTTTHGFRYVNGVMTDLGTLVGAAGVSYANAINESGLIAGRSNASIVTDHAVLWNGATMTDLGTLEGASGHSEAMGLNDNGWVVGNSTYGGNGYGSRHAFLSIDGVMTDLGSLGGNSFARDVNNAGQVVGYSYLANGYTLRPFIWEDGVMTDLSTLADFAAAGFNLAYGLGQIWDINEYGQIAGWGITSSFTYEAFLLTPTTPINVPEPSSAGLILAAASVLAVMRRRRG